VDIGTHLTRKAQRYKRKTRRFLVKGEKLKACAGKFALIEPFRVKQKEHL